MTAPFAPELISPKNKGASAAASVTLSWRFRSVVAGDVMFTYAVRRRIMTPSIGSFEYWTGTVWSATETFLTGPVAPNAIQDGMTFPLTITVGWTTDRVYQWSVKTRNAAAEASVYADDNLILVHAAPSMAVTVSSTAISRPTLAWVWSGAATYFQKTYRLAIYTAAVRNAFGFDASLAVWQAQATWITATKYSSTDYKATVAADLASGTQYYFFYQTTDNSDLSSGWIESGNFTPSYTAVPPPTIQLTPDAANGVVNTVVRSSFNLLADNSSVFTTGIDNWVGTLNCEPSWSAALQKLIVTCGGMSFAALDAAFATFALQDTGSATFATEKATQAAPTGTARVMSGDQAGERVAVSPSIAYSAIATVNNQSGSTRTGKLGIRWYKADNSASAITVISQGTGTTLGAGADVFVSVQNVTSPADAAFGAIEFEWTTAAVGDVMRIDDVAMASTTSISWSPSGQNFDISFVLERSLDQVTWTPVWGMSQAAPKASDSGAVTQATTVDRSVPLGTNTIFYRAYAISKFTTSPLWSAQATANIPGMDPVKWWMRRTSRSDHDVRVVVNQISIDQVVQHQTIEAEGQALPLVYFSSLPKTQTVDISLMSMDKATYDLVMEALTADETLYVQTNLDGFGYYIRTVGSFKRQQRRAVGNTGFSAVRNLFDISFQAVVVGAFV